MTTEGMHVSHPRAAHPRTKRSFLLAASAALTVTAALLITPPGGSTT
ncbi:hypothetical protein S1361_30780 [Streptomyces cyanogenus]|uniref:Uncharacterized protein n=1 Tax=Streptomyces cyanogenus TaxID=80860 RepID=A0ABX7TY87_STRCY|nr:hypothetical protein S1361_30780 [Streptomyces cyanogenus]